ncbi:MAG: nucleoside triphosphate pyrophosphohydrolase [Clostridium sp.]|nr:nucleoside triphosphate pyrophosphohydrolase [Clostridium sp.]MCM1547459.1 nucleoside triphosphate pyrophosphohydrolase [Ruminococcus sp.]
MVNFQKKENYNIDDLREIMAILRCPEGCPWDREQDHKSIRNDFIEEVYEAVEAIDLDDNALLREELGDVLLQVVFHCRIEEEKNSFDFDDICDELCKKLIVRHPHVFGDISVSDSEEVLKNWDSIKKQTKGQETYTDTLKAVAASLPSLMRAQKVGKRAMRAGMDFDCLDDAFECVKAETAELETAIKSKNKDDIFEEFGDLLFSCVNVARHLGIDAEEAMTRATEKFIERFEKTEEAVRHDGADMKALGINELDVYWNKVKMSGKK